MREGGVQGAMAGCGMFRHCALGLVCLGICGCRPALCTSRMRVVRPLCNCLRHATNTCMLSQVGVCLQGALGCGY